MTSKPMVTGLFILWCSTVASFLFCSGGTGNVAGGLETTNGITMTAFANEIRGTTFPETQIIISDTANAPLKTDGATFADTVYAENNGKFVLAGVPAGIYNLIAQKSDFSSGCIIRNIRVDSSSTGAFRDSSRFVPLETLTVVVKLDAVPQINSFVFIRGTTFRDSTAADGSGLLVNIPAGLYRIETIYKMEKDLNPKIYSALADSVPVDSTDTADTLTLDLQPLP
jgi:hypothetical protein